MKNMNSQSIIFFLMGPTAIGKTAISLKIKKQFPQIELLSVDSKSIYRGLNIGTDKPNKKDLHEIFYRLIDIKDPQHIYSVVDFYRDATKEIRNILSFGKIPLLVGGTMLYFKTLINGFACLPPSNPEIRNYIFNDICFKKKKNLFNILKKIDIKSSKKFHINDVQRVLRAVEVFFISGGKPLSTLITSVHKKLPYKIFQFGIIPHDKNLLYEKIVNRFYRMLDQGFEREVRALYEKKCLNLSYPSMNSIGYKQMWLYFQKKYTYTEMIDNSIKSTFKLVKHQLTWLRNWKNIFLVEDNKLSVLIQKIKSILLSRI